MVLSQWVAELGAALSMFAFKHITMGILEVRADVATLDSMLVLLSEILSEATWGLC